MRPSTDPAGSSGTIDAAQLALNDGAALGVADQSEVDLALVRFGIRARSKRLLANRMDRVVIFWCMTDQTGDQ